MEGGLALAPPGHPCSRALGKRFIPWMCWGRGKGEKRPQDFLTITEGQRVSVLVQTFLCRNRLWNLLPHDWVLGEEAAGKDTPPPALHSHLPWSFYASNESGVERNQCFIHSF